MEQPELGAIIWFVIYFTLTVLVYVTYGIALSINDYPDKDEKMDAVGLLAGLSALLFLASGALVAMGFPTPAAGLVLGSLITDYIIGGMVGTSAFVKDKEGNLKLEASPGLTASLYIPIAVKTVLFGYLTFTAGAYQEEKSTGRFSIPGRSQFREPGESDSGYMSRRYKKN